MPTVSSTDGSPTSTCWKRRSRAASFSMCSRYSSRVVAPTIRSSPRASIGLIMLPMLARGELRMVGATTLDEYREHIEKDAALERRFQQVLVGEPSVED